MQEILLLKKNCTIIESKQFDKVTELVERINKDKNQNIPVKKFSPKKQY